MSGQWQWPRQPGETRPAAAATEPAPEPSPAPPLDRTPPTVPPGPGSRSARNFARTGTLPPRSPIATLEPALANAVTVAESAANEEVKFRVHRRLIQELEATRLHGLPDHEAREAVEQASRQILQQEAPGVFGLARDELIASIVDEVLGLGPIQPLIRDSSITEIMVNAPDIIYYEREGRLYRSPVRFRDNSHIMRIIERIISPLGRRVDEASPMVDARLADGSRVNVVIPPVAPKSPSITIRKFRQDKMKIADLVSIGSLSPESQLFLDSCVRIRRNIIVSGGTGSGKTTLLNALSASIPESERI